MLQQETINICMASGIKYIAVSSVYLLTAIISFVLSYLCVKEKIENNMESDEDYDLCIGIFSMIGMICTIIFLFRLPNVIVYIINPKIYAILKLVK